MVKVGVLGLQGAFREHAQALEAAGAETIIIKKVEQLNEIDGFNPTGRRKHSDASSDRQI
ncbi:glutamine amidotransferase PdxT [Priestia megaterium]